MFNEKKINELLRGASPKKKASSKQKDTPHKEATQNKRSDESRTTSTRELTRKDLEEIEVMIGSASGAQSSSRQQVVHKKEQISRKNLQTRQEYIHERKLAEDRLKRLKNAEKRIEELERERREDSNRIAEKQAKQMEYVQAEAQRKITEMQEQLTHLNELVSKQEKSLEALQAKNKELSSQSLELHAAVERASQQNHKSKGLTEVFQDRGLHIDEYQNVMLWLIKTGIFPLSYIQTDHYELLQQILHDKCHIQAENIPIPKESSDIYIDTSFERCPLSGGYDIMEQARLLKDECLIHGYTTIVIFGTQGLYEPLFQILFAHHALRVSLFPAIETLSSEEINNQIQANQLSFSWGEGSRGLLNYTSSEKTVGEFLHDLVSYLRSLT